MVKWTNRNLFLKIISALWPRLITDCFNFFTAVLKQVLPFAYLRLLMVAFSNCSFNLCQIWISLTSSFVKNVINIFCATALDTLCLLISLKTKKSMNEELNGGKRIFEPLTTYHDCNDKKNKILLILKVFILDSPL